ncbi:MAG: thioredoxin [Hungatella sp.]|nr:thioredoxin [Hungatella sp.]
MMAMKLTSGNFETEVYQSEIPVLVDFYADWCGPCKAMAPVVETLADEYAGKAKVGKMNTDENQDIAMEYGIMSIPTFLVFKGGKVVNKMIGMQDKRNLVAAIEEAL